MRDYVPMPTRRLRTANYSADARQRLGDAVAKAREAAGFKHVTKFARAAGIDSVASVRMLESGRPGVAQSILFAVGRFLPGWTEDTPRSILEGADPPPIPSPRAPEVDTEPATDDAYGESITGFPVGSDEWLEYYAEFPEAVKAGIEVRRKRRELEWAERYAAKLIAERREPHEAGRHSP